MTDRDEIIRMAREAGLPETATDGVFIVNSDDLGRMLAAEREACANDWEAMHGYDKHGVAAAIRARGQA